MSSPPLRYPRDLRVAFSRGRPMHQRIKCRDPVLRSVSGVYDRPEEN